MNKPKQGSISFYNQTAPWYVIWGVILTLEAIGIGLCIWLNQNAASFKVPDGIIQ